MREGELQFLLQQLLGGRWQLRPLGASSITETWQATREGERLFVKDVPEPREVMLEAEADGLRALAATHTVRVPALAFVHGGVLAMEWLDFAAPDAGFGERLGRALAALHSHAVPVKGYGWTRDNFIGATPQPNTVSSDWADFFLADRLGNMLRRLDGPRELLRAVEQVMELLPELFATGAPPKPSLIHGDLWSGNWGMLKDGTPVVYDPAVSCSDAEAELAMMELFGTPPAGFAQAYAAVRPRPRDRRRTLAYQLYHLLNHAVMFGGEYEQQALRVAREII